MQNIKELQTTIPTIIASLVTICVVGGFLPVEVSKELEMALIGLSTGILTLIGVFSRLKK